MELSCYPLDPPASRSAYLQARPPARTAYTYTRALHHGNPFLSLPQHIRNTIYIHALSSFLSTENTFAEVPTLGPFTNPDICEVDDLFYAEACQVIIRETKFVLTCEEAVWNFMVWLEEFSEKERRVNGFMGELVGGEGFANVRNVEILGLGVWERCGGFASPARMLIKRCPNLRSISLIVGLEQLTWVEEMEGVELDLDAMTKFYDIGALVVAPKLDIIKLCLEPSMSLQKKLTRMETARKKANRKSGRQTEGVEGFWSLKEWLQIKFLEQMRQVEVICPCVEEA